MLPEVLSIAVANEDFLGPEAVAEFSTVLQRADALAIGPGLGAGPAQRGLVEKVLETVELPVVVDADGLNALAGRTEALARRRRATVITPHPAELARLSEVSTDEIQADRVGAATRTAQRFDCVVLLKGFRTIVADRSGAAVINPSGGPALATAGTGDVLTGVVGAFLAKGMDGRLAAAAAATAHTEAAAEAPQRAGLVASDVIEMLPYVLGG
jgi:NAD(P)H-hydrate epimerase